MPQGIALAVALPLTGRLYDKVGPWPLIIPGIIGAAYATFQLHDLNLSTSDATLIKILMLRGVSSALMFIPAITLTMSLVPRDQLPQASALTNSLRQLFPAFATAAFATILTVRQAFHFGSLAQTVTPDSLAVIQVLSGLERAAGRFAGNNGMAEQSAILMLDLFVQRQAAVKAFDDTFFIAAILILAALVPALFLRRPEKEEEQAPAANRPEAEPQPAD